MRFLPIAWMVRLFATLLAVSSLACGSKAEAPDWNRKDAHRFCAPAIDAYPDGPAPPCAAMHMCANEASLSTEQQAKLLDMIRKTDGCAQP